MCAEQYMLSNVFIYTYCELSAAATICIGVGVGLSEVIGSIVMPWRLKSINLAQSNNVKSHL